jgi:F-type H+-transporting ATPase subunit b
LEKLGINLGFLIVQIINFAIIFIVLYKWVYQPLTKMMEKRREIARQGLEDARIAAEARAHAEEEAAKVIQEAQTTAAQMVREANERAEKTAQEVINRADEEIERSREIARNEIEQERNRILGEMRGQISALAIAAAQKLIGESLDEARQHRLVEEFFSGVKGNRVVVLQGATLQGNEAEVTSALPLTVSEQDLIRKEIQAQMGAGVSVHFLVDPAIMGGLVIRASGQVLDGSIANQLEVLRQSLK